MISFSYGKKNKCELKQVNNWLNLFIDHHDKKYYSIDKTAKLDKIRNKTR